MSKKIILLVLLFSLTLLNANEENNSSKPIVKKSSWGIEINPFRLPYSIFGPSFSAGVNYFDYEDNFEISLPLTYNSSTVDRSYWNYGEGYNDSKYDYDEVDINLDLHFRKFLTSKVGDIYLGVFGRYTYLEGKLEDDYRLAKIHKFGLGIEVGFKVMGLFNGSPLYWGMSLGVGRYFSKNNGIFDVHGISLYMDDRQDFVDIEVLKLGYEF